MSTSSDAILNIIIPILKNLIINRPVIASEARQSITPPVIASEAWQSITILGKRVTAKTYLDNKPPVIASEARQSIATLGKHVTTPNPTHGITEDLP